MSQERRQELVVFLERFGLKTESVTLDAVEQALTHRSHAFEKQLAYDNERLEFLGDAVIGLLAAEHAFRRFPQAAEGDLSKHKGRLVSRTVLGRRGRELGLAEMVLLGRGEEQSGGRQRPALLGSVLEALVGALYLTFGWQPTAHFVRRHILDPLDKVVLAAGLADYKSELQEIVQKRFQVTPEYRLARESGPEHDRHFFVEVYVKGEKWGEGSGKRKKSAENDAARIALDWHGLRRPSPPVYRASPPVISR